MSLEKFQGRVGGDEDSRPGKIAEVGGHQDEEGGGKKSSLDIAKNPVKKTSISKLSRLPFKHVVSPRLENIAKTLTPKPTKTIQRDYVLNDSTALKKKLKWETGRKVEFHLSKEAKNGANVQIRVHEGKVH